MFYYKITYGKVNLLFLQINIDTYLLFLDIIRYKFN